MELGVSKKTVQNWEKGVSSPSFFQSLEWFRILRINPVPYYLTYIFPSEFRNLKHSDSDEKIESAFETLAAQLPVSSKRALLYLFFGEHGASPHAMLHLFLAYLHTPIKSRIPQAILVKNIYELERDVGNIICADNILPDIEVLDLAIETAKASAMQHASGYCFLECDPLEYANDSSNI